MNKIEKRPEGVGIKLFKIIACSVFLVFSVFQSHQAFATEGVPAVTISVNDQGETIILADGEILAISAGDGWCTFELSPDVTIKIFIDPVTGKATVRVVTGTVEVTVTSGGQTVTVQEGESTTASPGETPTPPAPVPPPPAPPELPDPPPEVPHSPSS
jgi:quercetin dioxygenase-like cupin family protein